MANPDPPIEHLKPHQIKPGEVRNPNGSSGKQRLTTALIRAIESKGLDDPLVQVGLREALKGDFRFWQYIFDRVDGKVKERVEHSERKLTVDRRDRSRKPLDKPPEPPPRSGGGEE